MRVQSLRSNWHYIFCYATLRLEVFKLHFSFEQWIYVSHYQKMLQGGCEAEAREVVTLLHDCVWVNVTLGCLLHPKNHPLRYQQFNILQSFLRFAELNCSSSHRRVKGLCPKHTSPLLQSCMFYSFYILPLVPLALGIQSVAVPSLVLLLKTLVNHIMPSQQFLKLNSLSSNKSFHFYLMIGPWQIQVLLQ